MSQSFKFSENILSFYEQFDEANRFSIGAFQLELARTQELLRRYLPAPPAAIYDIGGGPGVYAGWLAKLGYEVHLLDPVPHHIEQAKKLSNRQPDHPIASFTIEDARRLDYANSAADVVLSLGPLYHLVNRNERIAALKETHRVLKKNGMLFAAAISRFASTLDGLIQGFLTDPEFARIAKRDLQDGQHLNPSGNLAYFTESYFHGVNELEQEIAEAGLALEQTLVIEGPGWLLQNFDD